MKYDPVGAALRRRKDAGVCLICGGKLVTGLKGPKHCVNWEDGRHSRPGGRKLRVKLK